MKYYAYNNSTGKVYELAKEHFDGRTLYLANRFGSYSPVSYTEILEIQAGKPSQYKVKTESGKFKIFDSEVIDQFLPKFYKEPEKPVEETKVDTFKLEDTHIENKTETELELETIKEPVLTEENTEPTEVNQKVQSDPKPIKTTVRKKRSASKKTSN